MPLRTDARLPAAAPACCSCSSAGRSRRRAAAALRHAAGSRALASPRRSSGSSGARATSAAAPRAPRAAPATRPLDEAAAWRAPSTRCTAGCPRATRSSPGGAAPSPPCSTAWPRACGSPTPSGTVLRHNDALQRDALRRPGARRAAPAARCSAARSCTTRCIARLPRGRHLARLEVSMDGPAAARCSRSTSRRWAAICRAAPRSSATSPSCAAWRRCARTSWPTSATSCARRSPPSAATPRRCRAARSTIPTVRPEDGGHHPPAVASGSRELVEDLLELSRLESRELQLAQEPVPLAAVARQRAAEAVRPKAAGRSASRCSCDVPDGPRRARATRARSSRCCSTCSTTRSSTRPRAAGWSCTASARGGHAACCAVKDTGAGHRGQAPPPHLRALLPGGQGPQPGHGRHGAGAVHRQAPGGRDGAAR